MVLTQHTSGRTEENIQKRQLVSQLRFKLCTYQIHVRCITTAWHKKHIVHTYKERPGQ